MVGGSDMFNIGDKVIVVAKCSYTGRVGRILAIWDDVICDVDYGNGEVVGTYLDDIEEVE